MKFDLFSRKKFKCDICKEKFKTETELRQHNMEGKDRIALQADITDKLHSLNNRGFE